MQKLTGCTLLVTQNLPISMLIYRECDILMCLHKDRLLRVLTCGSDSAVIHPATVETGKHTLSTLQLDSSSLTLSFVSPFVMFLLPTLFPH